MTAREIVLTRGLSAVIDEADADRVLARQWHAHPRDQKMGGWYACRTVQRRTIYLHRFILDAPAGILVDHRNGDGLDNRRENLRLCTRALNNANRAAYPSAAGYRGVWLDGAQIRAAIYVEGRLRRLGNHKTPEDAARAYDAAAFHHYGEFARLNFPAEWA